MPRSSVISSADVVAATNYISTALPKLKASFHTGTLNSSEVTQIKAMLTYGYNEGKLSSADKTEADTIADTLQA